MNLTRFFEILELIRKRLPKSHPKLNGCILYENVEQMAADYKFDLEKSYLFAAVDLDTQALILPLHLEAKDKPVRLDQLTDDSVASLILHEIGHLWLARKKGRKLSDKEDERQADRFAARWVRTLKKEDLL